MESLLQKLDLVIYFSYIFQYIESSIYKFRWALKAIVVVLVWCLVCNVV